MMTGFNEDEEYVLTGIAFGMDSRGRFEYRYQAIIDALAYKRYLEVNEENEELVLTDLGWHAVDEITQVEEKENFWVI